MGLPPARAKAMNVVLNLEPRRRLSRFFASVAYRTEKSGTVPAAQEIRTIWLKPCLRHERFIQSVYNGLREQSHFFSARAFNFLFFIAAASQ